MKMKPLILCQSLLILIFFLYPRITSAITFSPVKIFWKIETNEPIKKSVRLFNESGDRISVHTEIVDFKESDHPGVPLFTKEKLPTGLHSLVSLPITDFYLESKESRDFDFFIQNSTANTSGSHFGAIHFITNTIHGNRGVGTSSATGPLIFITIPSAEMPTILTELNPTIPQISSHQPINISLSIKNAGDIIVQPSGTFQIKNLFGKVIKSYPLEPDGAIILPYSSREFHTKTPTNTINSLQTELSHFGFGKYTLQFNANLNSESPIQVSLADYWVIPWRLLLIGMISALMILAFFRRLHERQ